MKAKPVKCKHIGMKVFGSRGGKYQAYSDTSYSAFDAKLQIAGQVIEFIASNLFKFLGRKIKFDLSETEQIDEISSKSKKDLQSVDSQPINGFMKLWLYQNYILAFLSWPFMVYDLNVSESKRMEASATKFLKKWAGIPHPATTSILYRSGHNKGIHLTPVALHYKKMQILKAHTIKHSKDSDLSTLSQACLEIGKKP